eukprot:m.112795 g.112795  ORF g.112795 m.112795 type:complete len:103 (-) comp14103_c1_seq2:636-944(-)
MDTLQYPSAKEMLLALPHGAYTTLRTVGAAKGIYQGDMHIQRLRDSTLEIHKVTVPEDFGTLVMRGAKEVIATMTKRNIRSRLQIDIFGNTSTRETGRKGSC